MNIAIFTRGLSNVMGGMERQLLSIASGFIERGHNVIVISLDAEDAQPYFDSDPRIQFIGLSIGDSAVKASVRVRYLRQKKVYKLLKEFRIDLSLAFMTGSFWYAALPSRIRRVPIILAERNGPSIYTQTRVRKYRHAIFASMNLASVITVQFETYRKGYPLYLRGKIKVIPNKIPNFSPKAKPNSEVMRYLFAGRLSNQKQITQLVQAFIQFHANHQDTELLIFGEGELGSELRKMLLDCHAETYIQLNPATKDIKEVLERGDVMIAPSLWEGFPNSVAEALAFGLPVGGFNDCEGVRDLIVDQENGWLVSREDPIASQVSLLEVIYHDRGKLPVLSHAAQLSVRNFQGEGPNEYWSHLVSSLVNR